MKRLLSPRYQAPLLKLCLVLGAMWLLLSLLNAGKNLIFLRSYSTLNYTDECLEKDCSCSAILEGDMEAVAQAKLLTIVTEFRKKIHIPDEYYIKATNDCMKFKLKRKYFTFPLSKEEQDFPIAYSIVVHHKMQNFERLLRAIYAPQNFYCIHVDQKSPPSFWAAVSAVASCFPNVFLASRSESVVYASWSRVQADINCMEDLYRASSKWKYFINLCGQDFPLKTNLEMVRVLRTLNGNNNLESERMPPNKLWRVNKVHRVVDGRIQPTTLAKGLPPFNVTIFSGNAYIVASRGFVRSVLEDERVMAVMEWAKDTFSPDEILWASIQRMAGVPGSKWPHVKYDMSDLNAVARLVKWRSLEGPQGSSASVYPICRGTHVRDICVYGAGDLQWLIQQHHFFGNKFDIDIDAVSIYCLEKYLRNKALAESL
ncbi:beta-1,3-galactosyl-O-glycosyl-glycoprotein beta-1,6-N-acetylglucosaminyltransferase isoform X1 [Synchiropus splendidus]|uniref:beta-1,3-galactosyl-O-glycosyl-glycoprotein beta-1,6-N-acetylglucosaminyltransferase isoform X1 n=1 Tax=Synchiropus splendidus TaxID=270530 RepID=UPI00237DB809|nr:beta-1,3-galactosyl-O-glycosyl-glycoprotein beta-1,6-N-acetylglucosaminyltransferase isoform X1 [Synchiropus splendidus]XP_053726468.1 beta-1,3-galactosyl-O-glycosyl-glycoprotein beta-1,6-N-acetylglucosaminyltransferase isoform X1 [Synchiropus splendidus]XP_053726469.1 beta-1,3-galactosyl-O-glycosyl-glycoprotein beta-1,6-N-acetylglucosaminyltransferase isoform X1 [Synchiropus splendidus]